MSAPVNYEIDDNLRKAVKVAAAQHDTSAADLLREAIRKAEADPNTLVDAVSLALKSPEPMEAKKVSTSAVLDAKEKTALDTFARKLATSRNSVIDLLLRAVLSGLVK